MTYRFIAFSEEVENFVMEIKAPPSASFLELHKLILKTCNYSEQENHQFLICDENWRVKEKVHLTDSGSSSLDEDLYLMESTFLEDFIEEEGQYIAYIYDVTAKKTLLIEHTENIFGEKEEKAFVSRQKGIAPLQSSEEFTFINEKSILSAIDSNTADQSIDELNDEDTISNDDFSVEEIDMEGFEVTDL